MTGNKAVAYKGPGKVELIDIGYPTFELKDGPGVNPANVGRQVRHGAILKTVATNICGSDQHMVRGRTTAPLIWCLVMRSPVKWWKWGRTSSSSKWGTSVPSPSTSPAGAAGTAKNARRASA